MAHYEPKAVRTWREDVLTTLTKLDSGQTATNEHLARLNGKVAAHEEALNSLKLVNATRKESSRLIGIALNAGWGLVGALGTVVAEHVFKLI